MLFFDYDIMILALGTATYYCVKAVNKRGKRSKAMRSKRSVGNSTALLIGCDYEDTGNELRGCSKDVQEMDKFLSDKGFNNTILCDDDDRRLSGVKDIPTGVNIAEEMKNLAAEAGDKVFVHYSGHGTYVRDKNNDEDDMRDEAIVATDNVLIVDDQINAGFLSKLPETTKCMMLMDCCHSGTICDLKHRYVPGTNPPVVESLLDTTRAEIICISGCMDTQTSADAYIDSSYRGAMTTAFLACYKVNKGEVTVKEHLHQMRDYLKKNNYEQIPQLTYNHQGLGDELLNYFLKSEANEANEAPKKLFGIC